MFTCTVMKTRGFTGLYEVLYKTKSTPIIQQLLSPIIVLSFIFFSLSYHCEGTLLHSSLQHCLSSLRFVWICLYTALLISIRLMAGLWMDLCRHFVLFLFSRSVVDVMLCFGSLCCSFSQTEYLQRSLRLTWWLQGAQVLWLQNKLKSLPLHHRDW